MAGSKPTAEQLKQFAELRKQGLSAGQVAHMLGVSIDTVCQWARDEERRLQEEIA